MNNVHLKIMASLLKNQIKQKKKKINETGFYITWLPCMLLIVTIHQRQGDSQGNEGRIEVDFLLNICRNCFLLFNF